MLKIYRKPGNELKSTIYFDDMQANKTIFIKLIECYYCPAEQAMIALWQDHNDVVYSVKKGRAFYLNPDIMLRQWFADDLYQPASVAICIDAAEHINVRRADLVPK